MANDTDTKYTKATISSDATILVNNVQKSSISVSDFVGTVELADTSKSGSYDSVKITTYKTYVVKSSSSTEKKIYDNYRLSTNQGNLYEVKDEDVMYNYVYKTATGSTSSFSGISIWSVLSINESVLPNGKTNVEVIISTATVSGSVTETALDENYIKIDDKKYSVSKYFKEQYITAAANTVNTGDEGKFYLDKDNKIAAFVKSASKIGNYGYLIKGQYKSSTDKAQIAILTSSGSLSTSMYLAKKVKIDGASYSAEEAVSHLKTVAADNTPNLINVDMDDNSSITYSSTNGLGVFPQLIKYSTNSSGEIDGIDTIVMGTNETTDSNLSAVSLSRKTDALMTYEASGSSGKFTGTGSSSFMISSSTIGFIVPNNRDNTSGSSYSKMGSAFSSFLDGKSYCVEAYNVGTNGIASVVVLYGNNTDAEITETSPILFVNKISSSTNSAENGEEMQTAGGYLHTKAGGSLQSNIWCDGTNVLKDKETGTTAQVGDVIRYGKTGSGYIRDGEVEITYSPYGAMPASQDEYYDDAKTSLIRTVSGYVYNTIDDSGKTLFVSKTNKVAECATAPIVNFDIQSDTQFYTFDNTKNEKVTLSGDVGLSYTLSSLTSYLTTQGSSKPSEVFLYISENKLKAVYIIVNRGN